jgi:isoleucyl-tRNA synthetase
VLYCNEALQTELQKLANELRFVLITSTAEVRPLSEAQNAEATELPGLLVVVKKSEYVKCARCWHHRADVGANTVHPEICLRCVDNVEGAGEARSFA